MIGSGKTYAAGKLNFDVDEIIKRSEQQIFNVANKKRKDGSSFRNSNVIWINNDGANGALAWPELTKHIVNRTNPVNKKYWGFDLLRFESLQYSIYNVGDYYDWHSDQHGTTYKDGMIRKLSFVIMLNDDYEGGDFEIAQLSGGKELPQIDITNVSTTILAGEGGMITQPQPSAGTMVVFPSYLWHRVAPVTKGVRKSLVGWVVGKPFI